MPGIMTDAQRATMRTLREQEREGLLNLGPAKFIGNPGTGVVIFPEGACCGGVTCEGTII